MKDLSKMVALPASPLPGEVTFRPAVHSDWGRSTPLDSTEAVARKIWLEPADSAVYVAELHTSEAPRIIIAAMQTKPMRYGNGCHVANFDLMVAPKARGLGIGRQLASFVIKECRRKGYRAMEAYSVVSVNPAFEAMGEPWLRKARLFSRCV